MIENLILGVIIASFTLPCVMAILEKPSDLFYGDGIRMSLKRFITYLLIWYTFIISVIVIFNR